MIKQIKTKEKGIIQENNQLKEILKILKNYKIQDYIKMMEQIIIIFNNNNQLNHTMFNVPVNNNILNDNNSMVIDSNNQ